MVTLGMNIFLFLVAAILLIQCCGGANYCQEAVDSVKIVEFCPTSKAEWDNAARMKNCDEKALKQNCSTVDRFVYHCVINGYRNVTLEVCAPTRIIFGHCVEFNVGGGVIQDQLSASCNEHYPKCDAYYLSSNAYKYSDCYNLVVKRDTYQSTTTKDASIVTIDLKKPESTYLLIGLVAIVTLIIIVVAVILIRRRQRQTERSTTVEEKVELLPKENDIEDDNATQGQDRKLNDKGMPIERTTLDTCIRRSSTFATYKLSKTTTPILKRSSSVNNTNDIKIAHEEFLRDIIQNLTGKQMDSTNTSEKNDGLMPEKNDIEQDTLSERATTDKRRVKRHSSFCITILNSMETMTPFLRRSFSIGLTKDIEKTRSQYVTVGILKKIKNIFNWTRQPSLKPIFYVGANEQSNVEP